MALIAVYLYKNKGSYRTHETVEEGEADKSLQEKGDPSEEKQEYFMWFAPTADCSKKGNV